MSTAPTKYGHKGDDYGPHVIEGAEDFVQVAEIGEWGYSWHLLRAWYSPSRDRFYWVADSGRSCNSIEDTYATLSDFSDGDRAALIRAIEAEFAGGYTYTPDALAKEIHAVRTWRYEPDSKENAA